MKSEKKVDGKAVRVGGLTEVSQQTPPPLPNVANPTREEMSKEREMGPTISGGQYAVSRSTIGLQQGKAFTHSKEINGAAK